MEDAAEHMRANETGGGYPISPTPTMSLSPRRRTFAIGDESAAWQLSRQSVAVDLAAGVALGLVLVLGLLVGSKYAWLWIRDARE